MTARLRRAAGPASWQGRRGAAARHCPRRGILEAVEIVDGEIVANAIADLDEIGVTGVELTADGVVAADVAGRWFAITVAEVLP